jgi:nitrogen fixation NifU-like protein
LSDKLHRFGVDIHGAFRAYDSSIAGWSSIEVKVFTLYSKQIQDHYAAPRNVGCLEKPSGRAIVKSPLDSDAVLITLRIEHGIIQDVKFKCMGCAVAIACSSVATEMVRGKTVEEGAGITEQTVAEALGGIPAYKMLCSNLAPEAIRRAIADWRSGSLGETTKAPCSPPG